MMMQAETLKGCSGSDTTKGDISALSWWKMWGRRIRSHLMLLPLNLPIHQATSVKGSWHCVVGEFAITSIAQVLTLVIAKCGFDYSLVFLILLLWYHHIQHTNRISHFNLSMFIHNIA